MTRTPLAALAALSLLSACGGGGGAAPAASTQTAAAPGYAFIAPKTGAHLVYAEKLVDNLNNTLNRSITDDVTAVNADGSFAVHEEDPSHATVVSGATDQTAYPTDLQYNAAGQQTGKVIAGASGSVTCATTGGNEGAPSPLAVGAGWTSAFSQACAGGAGVAYTQSGTLAGIETITVAAGTFSAYKFVATTSWALNGITRTETSTRWRDASGAETRTLKQEITVAYSGGTPAAGSPVSRTRELQSYR
jgi:hypothetical protein